MTTYSTTPASRQALVEAALSVAMDEGFTAMTLDRVAKAAGVSKGGLMYHFPTKDDLLRGMISFFGQQVQRMLEHRVATDPNPQQRLVRALANTAFPQTPEDALPLERNATASQLSQFYTSLIAATSMNPELLKPLREVGQQQLQRILNESTDPLGDLLLWLAIDGLFLWELLGLVKPGDPLRSQLVDAIRARVGVAS